MIQRRGFVHICLISTAVVALGACGDDAPTGVTDPTNGTEQPPPPAAQSTLTITTPSGALRQGDVVDLVAELRDTTGALVPDADINWSTAPFSAGVITTDERFLPQGTDSVFIFASVPGVAVDTSILTIEARAVGGSFTLVGASGALDRLTTDLWVHGNYAYTATLGSQVAGVADPGRTLFVWDISNPSSPLVTDSVKVDAPRMNDVKVRADGALAIITHENSTDGLNGITILDLADPAHPTIISRFTDELETGVHNIWIEGDVVYVAVDGGGFRVLDISDPTNPTITARISSGSATVLHNDVYVRDGLGFFTDWDNGLIIFDLGGGTAGGSPTNPVEISRILTAGGQTHNAWYWPAAGYVFVGEEDV
ncbi:MAG: hypothetical protein V3V49_02155, partial [Candidatus Krumholzibacteria bacterium]